MSEDLQGWLPVRLKSTDDQVTCRWQFVGAKRFEESFFEETLIGCLKLPENSFGPHRITSLETIVEVSDGVECLEPSAFIFHVSRCGSTLVTQMLGLDDACVVLSEVPFFDEILRARFKSEMASLEVAKLLPAAIRLYGKRRLASERALVVKLDSWHIGFHAELRELYPAVPFILMYRDPRSVMKSHQLMPGIHSVSGLIENEVFGFAPGVTMNHSDYLPQVLESYYGQFLAVARQDKRSLLVSYQPDMVPAVESIAEFCGIELTLEHRENMRERARFHSKRPEESFLESRGEVEESPSLSRCMHLHEDLERLRREGRLTP